MSARPLALLLIVGAITAAASAGLPTPTFARSAGGASPVRAPADSIAVAEDYRRSAGGRVGDTVVVTLEMRRAMWRPQGDGFVAVPVFVFAEPGTAPRVPGPMIRLREGGTLRVTLRNTLDKRVVVRGLQPRPHAEEATDSVAVLPGRDTTIVMPAGQAGSYFYYGRITPTVNHRIAPIPGFLWGGEKEEGPFVGALVVDGAGETPDPAERTFVITRWLDEHYPGINDTIDWKLAMNGAMFPATEPLSYRVGERVRWRVINASLTSHPMHLHGFYFTVRAHGAVNRDSQYTARDARQAVTELLQAGESMRMEWTPEKPGNWLFHCHLVRHMTSWQNMPRDPAAPTPHAAAGGHDHAMGGLVMGVTVHARAGRDSAAAEARARGANAARTNERDIRLLAQSRANVFGAYPGYSFLVQRGAAPAADSIERPSPTLVLKRGEPVRITVLNNITVPLAVHWHGMELESWFDGVGGFSGMGKAARAPIAPRDSFVVRFTPPRSGTFMFHTHDEPGHELASGLNGALVVVDDPASYDRTRDHVLLIATRGPTDSGLVVVNGSTSPPPITVTAGVPQRIRFATISSNERVDVALLRGDSIHRWKRLARDGADLPPHQRSVVRASDEFSAGMTSDVEIVVPPGATDYTLRVRMRSYEAFEYPGATVLIPIRVRR